MCQNNIIASALEGKFGWEFIVRTRNAFVTKAIAGISLSALILNSFGFFEHLVDGALLNFKITLVGSITFLVGYIFSNLRTPYEFQTGSSVPQLVVQKMNISSTSYIKQTIAEAHELLRLTRRSKPFDLPISHLEHLENCLKEIDELEQSEKVTCIGSIYDAELRVREWTNPMHRMVSVSLFGFGLLLIGSPTIFSLVQLVSR